MQMTMKRRYDSIDFLKGLSCIAVVLIHYNFPGFIGLAVKNSCCFAVPIFFFVSGFFCLSNGRIDDGSLCRKLRHIFRLIIGSACFYAVFVMVWTTVIYHCWYVPQYIEQEFTAANVVRFFVTNDFLAYPHLWSLLALMYSYLTLLLFFHQPSRLKLIRFLAPLLLIGYCCLQEFNSLLGVRNALRIIGTDKELYLFNLFIFRALPFIFFGILARQYEEKLIALPISQKWLIIGALFGCMLSIGERLLWGQQSQFYIGSYITVACMVLWALKKPEGGWKPMVYIGRELSLYVYIIHVAVAECVRIVAGKLRLWEHPVYLYGKSPVVLILTLCSAYVMLRITKCVYCKRKALHQNMSA